MQIQLSDRGHRGDLSDSALCSADGDVSVSEHVAVCVAMMVFDGVWKNSTIVLDMDYTYFMLLIFLFLFFACCYCRAVLSVGLAPWPFLSL